MTKVLISVEGQTEETVVRDVLVPMLAPQNVYLFPVLLKTKRVPGGSDFKGGYVPYNRMRKVLENLLGDTSAAAVTTMYDYYALPRDFPGLTTCHENSGVAQAECLEAALLETIGHRRFRPFLQVHEFEALLFAGPEHICRAMGGTEVEILQLRRIRQGFPSAEEINDDPQTSPAHRIHDLFPQYNKVLHGPQIVRDIGLDTIRAACPHFDTWLDWLESL
jgi:hypothetical protein